MPDPRVGARAQLRLLQGLRPDILKMLAHGGRGDENGAIGHNQERWQGAQYQRAAGLYLLYAVTANDATAAEEAWRAIEFAFSHEDAAGSFDSRNRSGTPSAPKDVYSDAAFWLAQFAQAALVTEVSPMADTFRPRIERLLPKVRAAGALMLQGKDVLVTREEPATNRYFIDALGYALSGLLVGDPALVDAGAYFVDLGLKKQQPDGYFLEAGGADTSYNVVAILMMQVYDLYIPTPGIEAALPRAVAWELARLAPTGEIDVAGNSRTGLGQEIYFGKAKEVNYGEAVLALGYYGEAHPDPDAKAGAERAYAFHFKKKKPAE
jgi:hypothetical protein